MREQVKVTARVIGVGPDTFEAYYSIMEGEVHVFVSRTENIPSLLGRVAIQGIHDGQESQLFDCRLLYVGNEFDEYKAREALMGESETSFNTNQYQAAHFTLSNDILRFFDPVWKVDPVSGEGYKQQIDVKPEAERQTVIRFDDNTTLSILTGYRQSHSKVRFETHSSIAFRLHFKKAVHRARIFFLVKAIIDYYSLFCFKYIGINLVRLITDAETPVYYYEYKAGPVITRDYLQNLLIEQKEIENYNDAAMIDWVSQYEKFSICMGLVRDAEQVNDSQLKFICLSRALEIFHKEFFIGGDRTEEIYFTDLHAFIQEKSLSDTGFNNFCNRGSVRLSHRLYDLVRFAYDILSYKNNALLLSIFIRKNKVQKLVDTRNYYIHFSDSKKENAWRVDELGQLNMNLYLFLKVLLLKKFGFSTKAINRLIGIIRNSYFG